MKPRTVNFTDKFSLFSEHWSPRVIAEMNDYQFKLVKASGEFVWHSHEDTDEVFILIEGKLSIDFLGGSVVLSPGEMIVVPKGIEHRPHCENEAKILVVEPKGIVNTGETESELQAENDVWV